MRNAAMISAALAALVMVVGCATRREPVHVTVHNPPPPAPVIIERPAPVVVERPSVTVEERVPSADTPATTSSDFQPIPGKRYRVDDVDVIYDEPLRAYSVVGYDNYFYANGRFYRFERGRWEMSPHLRRDSNWIVIGDPDVPNSLVLRYRR